MTWIKESADTYGVIGARRGSETEPARAGETRAGLWRSGRGYFSDKPEGWAGAAGAP